MRECILGGGVFIEKKSRPTYNKWSMKERSRRLVLGVKGEQNLMILLQS